MGKEKKSQSKKETLLGKWEWGKKKGLIGKWVEEKLKKGKSRKFGTKD
jgi:hypothetical protein